MYQLFFHPQEAIGAAADFIPFYRDGIFHLFYLYDHRNPAKYGEGVTWYKAETRDFVTFRDCGEMLPRGSAADPDPWLFTGCVIEAEGAFHMFYTGHNPYDKRDGDYAECVMHAVSRDLVRWQKLPEDTWRAPEELSPSDFRDPFVYRAPSGLYHMLLCVRPRNACGVREGFTALFTSRDLKAWQYDGEFYAPRQYFAHECPDHFALGGREYLVFSEYSDRNVTRYRVREGGEWIKPAEDCFDGRAYYAAKTASDGERRYLFGWVPTREGGRDRGVWQWGGNLVVHELTAGPDGTLFEQPPKSVLAAFGKSAAEYPALLLDTPNAARVSRLAAMPQTYLVSFTVSGRSGQCGVLLGEDDGRDAAYAFTLDFDEHRLKVSPYPDFPQNEFNGANLYRVLPPAERYEVTLLVDDDVAVVYVNGRALTARFCDRKIRRPALYAAFCSAEFREIRQAVLG